MRSLCTTVTYGWRMTVQDPMIVRVRPAGRVLGGVVALVAIGGVWAISRLFVATRTGQLLDEIAITGAWYGRTRLWQVAEPVLDVISVPFITAVLVTAVLLAVLRKRVLLAVEVVLLLGGANLTTQMLKHVLLDRPDLGVSGPFNTLPSGHTTAAASCAAALVLVVPRRFRAGAAAVGAVYTAATGVSTLVGGWHRPSDAVAGVLVVVAWIGLISAVGGEGAPASHAEDRRENTTISLLLGAALVTGAGAALAAQRSLFTLGDTASKGQLLTAYGGGALGVVAAACLAFAVLLFVRRAAEPPLTALA